MAEEDSASEVDLNQVARIVSSYVRSHQLGPDQLVELIVAVHHALAALEQAAPPPPEPRKPAVPIRRSVQPDYVVCLECGFRAQTLRRHLRAEHGLSVDEYRAAGICGPIIRSPHPPIHSAAQLWPKKWGLAAGAARSSRLRQGGGDAGGDQRRNRETPFWKRRAPNIG